MHIVTVCIVATIKHHKKFAKTFVGFKQKFGEIRQHNSTGLDDDEDFDGKDDKLYVGSADEGRIPGRRITNNSASFDH